MPAFKFPELLAVDKEQRERFLDVWYEVSPRTYNKKFDAHNGKGTDMIYDLWTDSTTRFDSGRGNTFDDVWDKFIGVT